MNHLKTDINSSGTEASEALYLSIDGGGSKTEAVAFRANGQVVAHVLLNRSLNPNGAEVAALQVLQQVYDELHAHISMDSVAGIFVGLAGGSNPEITARFESLVTRVFHCSQRVQVMHDALGALWSGGVEMPALVLIAGTGTVVYGMDAQGRELRVGGWGYLIGDAGGGYDIGRRALQAVMAAHDGVGEATSLTERVFQLCGVESAPDLIPQVYREGKKCISRLAPLVCVAASEGDPVAIQIVSDVAAALAQLLGDAYSIVSKGATASGPISVVLVGGMWRSPEIRRAFKAQLLDQDLDDAVNCIFPKLPPVYGGARFLMRQLGRQDEVAFGLRFEQTFIESTRLTEVDSSAQSVSKSVPNAAPPGLNLAILGTEAGDPALNELDTMDSLEIVQLIAKSNQQAVIAVSMAAESIAAAIEGIFPRLVAGGRLFYVGAGTSGRLGVLDASECPPTFGVPFETVQGVIAGGDSALMYPAEGAEDDAAQGGRDLLLRGLTDRDVVVAIAASGRTPYCIGALQVARKVGALTVSLSCNQAAALSDWAEFPIEVATGAEIIAGSTRMKAGTAQKIVLNMLTTTVMIRMGKVYAGHMVDMIASNQKLKLRARRIVMQAGALNSEAAATQLLEQAEGNMKVAIVMARTGIDAKCAQQLLATHGGYVRPAIQAQRVR
ncbi:N-acetylmuramic acid 6-phosphate etherase [Coraliomargarita algicola]|uniref:N-acetylmuramic acid 6-phosphate etherase n=1 Tax=Coraliomargarita algicola TaxID=3092156 RepID=A0ABZ0RM77_9BACT|nr:N-acetylmuramic acid 6-phosphate etherase [Coraliomargarita sp. J2-16]WPJ96528.1 N-acetylmuramic acid 6-phosphate etherase [Coraliomargarita sp. J2-16]